MLQTVEGVANFQQPTRSVSRIQTLSQPVLDFNEETFDIHATWIVFNSRIRIWTDE